MGVGNITVTGGDAKSYYIKVGEDKVAYRLYKKRYKKEFLPLWKACEKVIQTYKNIKWKELPKHIIDYTVCED